MVPIKKTLKKPWKTYGILKMQGHEKRKFIDTVFNSIGAAAQAASNWVTRSALTVRNWLETITLKVQRCFLLD